jgi:hypothetical protein
MNIVRKHVPLKELESWLKRGQYVRFLRDICPPKKCTPNIGANIGAITGILLNTYGHMRRSVEHIQTTWEYFQVYKKTRVLEKGCIVAKKEPIGPIFEGNMLP